jgi:hypothetical protein
VRDRSKTDQFNARDLWDKNSRYTPKEWVAALEADLAKGDNSYVWTSIPDKVTARLKAMGYDGIIDKGGKGGGNEHRVAIPFDANQVRSPRAKFDPAKKGSSDLLAGLPMQAGIAGAGAAGAAMLGSPDAEAQTAPDAALLTDARDRAAKLRAEMETFKDASDIDRRKALKREGYDIGSDASEKLGPDATVAQLRNYRDAKVRDAIKAYNDKRQSALADVQKEIDKREAENAAYQKERAGQEGQATADQQAFRTYGPTVGAVLGGLALGYGARGLGVLGSHFAAGKAAKTIGNLISNEPVKYGRGVAARNAQLQRTNNVNTVARMGGAKPDQVPFDTGKSGKKLGDVLPNKTPLPTGALFQQKEPSKYWRVGDYAVAGAGAADTALSTYNLNNAQKERDDAIQDVKDHPGSLDSRKRLQAALDQVALWETMQRGGMTATAASVAAPFKLYYKSAKPSQELLGRYENEHQLLLRYLKEAGPDAFKVK